MMMIGFIILIVGLMGFFYTLLGSMILSLIFGTRHELRPVEQSMNFEILLAAHNEEKTILHSLESFQKAADVVNRNHSLVSLSVHVGLDHCTDETLSIVKSFANTHLMSVRYFENLGPRGKWFIVKRLIEESKADWVSLTDCGSLWHQDLILRVSEILGSENIFCVAPSYLPIKAKFLETMYWRMEQLIRSFENKGGGSIMVHGPTVFYKRSSLVKALDLLGKDHWFNDDVAIPMIMRLDDPKNRVHYFASKKNSAWVRDIGVVSDVQVERRRRKRIMIGNLQVIRNLIFPKFSFIKLSSWSGLRLVFKVMWAYWLTFVVLGSACVIISLPVVKDLVLKQNISMILFEVFLIILLGMSFRYSNYLQRLFMAYLSGLGIYKGWKALETPEKITWS